MNCPHCGQRHPDGATYCPNTGARIEGAGIQRRRGLPVAFWAGAILLGLILAAGLSWLAAKIFIGPRGSAPTESPVPISMAEVQYTSSPTSIPMPSPTDKGTVVAALPPKSPMPSNSATAQMTPAPDWRQGRLAFVGKMTGKLALYELDLGSGESSPRLLVAPEGSESYRGASWSPDGGRVAFYIYRTRALILDVQDRLSVQTDEDCNSPVWSPDGKRIICGSNRGGGSVFLIIDANSGQEVGVLDPGINGAVIPVWSPTRDEVVFGVLKSGGTSIWRISLSGDDLVQLSDDISWSYAPAWSPDGDRIAYQSVAESENSEIWVMDRDGGQKQRITYTAGGGARAPTWSPDGRWLAYVSNQAGSVGAEYGEIFVVAMESGEVRQVTSTGGQVYEWRVWWGR